MFVRCRHSNFRAGSLAAILLFIAGLSAGCSVFDTDRWSLAQYRDERATDIEKRLAREEPIVKNPF